MDATVSTALNTGLTDFADGAMEALTTALPLAIPLVIAISGVFLAIRLFRAIAHV